MTSKKTRKLIKRNIYKVDEVGVDFEKRAKVYIKVGGKSLNVVGFYFHRWNGVVDWKDNKEWQFLENIVIIPSISSNSSGWSSIRYQVRSIHSYICDVFNIDASQLSVKFSDFIHHNLFDIGTVKKCTIMEGEIGTRNSSELFEQQKNMILLVIERSREISACGYAYFYQHVPTVIHRNTQIRVNWFLTRFQGQHGLLENSFLTGFYVKAFLKLWSYQKMDNLVSMIAYQSVERLFDYERVLEVLEEKLRNSEAKTLKALQAEKPSEKRIYSYEEIITQEHEFEADTFDCDGGYDVVRNSDGKRATIKISKDYFMFFVWP
ncbi:hypothetical protein B9Z55_015401 [Caenorhabditis nigoni]|nr:hypothetical protein B9Z55_015401 [Caenorhabditis nigoni]